MEEIDCVLQQKRNPRREIRRRQPEVVRKILKMPIGEVNNK